MARGSNAARPHADLGRVRLGILDELIKCPGGERWMHHYDVGHSHHARHWSDIVNEIEMKAAVERRVEHVRRTDQEERMAVRRRTHDCFGAKICPRPGAVFDYERLAKPF